MLSSSHPYMFVFARRANRKFSNFEEEDWSESIAVSANFLRCGPNTYTTACIWVPNDEEMNTVKGIR